MGRAGTPPGEEQRETDRVDEVRSELDGNELSGAALEEDLGDDLGDRGSSKEKTALIKSR